MKKIPALLLVLVVAGCGAPPTDDDPPAVTRRPLGSPFIRSPFGDDVAVNVVVFRSASGRTQALYQRKSDKYCEFEMMVNVPGGLDQDYYVTASRQSDYMENIVDGWSGTISSCSNSTPFSARSVQQNGFKINLSAGDGDDFIICGGQLTRCDGDLDNDTIHGYHAGNSLFGFFGNDKLYAWAPSMYLDAGPGNDCIQRNGFLQAQYQCNPPGQFAGGADVSTEVAGIQCNAVVPSCP